MSNLFNELHIYWNKSNRICLMFSYFLFSFLAPLITEYDKHLEELNGQLKYYQVWHRSHPSFCDIIKIVKQTPFLFKNIDKEENI